MPRRPSDFEQERVVIVFDHPGSLTADTTYKFWQAPRPCKVTDVRYINPTGLAEHSTNAFAGSVKNGSTVVATLFDTDSDEAGADNSLAADTFVTGVIVAAAAVLAADDVLSLFLDEDAAGAATFPAGRLQVEVVYL